MSGFGRRMALAVAGLTAVVALALPSVVAAGATFGTPTATSRWGEGVTFSQPIVLERAPLRVEIVVESPADTGAFVAEVPVATSRSTTLSYTLDVANGGYLPNTPFTARWRVTYPDRTVELGPRASTTYQDTRFDWRTSAGSIVRVHWYTGDAEFGARALRIADEAVAKVGGLLGVTERDPVDFFVYADEAAFYDALGPGTRENVGGTEIPEIRTLFGLITPDEINDSWVGTVITHELTHLVLHTAVSNPYHEPPRWLDEGLAVYLAQGYDASYRSMVEAAAGDGGLMPLGALTGQFPTTTERFALGYAESVSAVDYLVRTYGTEGLVRLVRSYAGGHSDDEAFTAALRLDSAAFGRGWLTEHGASDPTRYGPRPAPSGPLPSDWQGPAPDRSSGPRPDTPPSSAAAGGPQEAPAAPVPAAPIRTRDVAVGLALLAVLMGIVGLGLFVTGRRRRSALPADADIGETGEMDMTTGADAARIDREPPASGDPPIGSEPPGGERA